MALQLKLDNRRHEGWDNTAHLVEFDTVEFTRRRLERQYAGPCFVHLLSCEREASFAEYLQDWRSVVRGHSVLQGIGTSFTVLLARPPPQLLRTLDTLQYASLFWKLEGEHGKATRLVLALEQCQPQPLDGQTLACFSASQDSCLSECALNLLAGLSSRAPQALADPGPASLSFDLDSLAAWLLKVYSTLNGAQEDGQALLLFVARHLTGKNMESRPSEFCLLLKVLGEHFKAFLGVQPHFDWDGLLANLLTLYFLVEVRHEAGQFAGDPALAPYELQLPALGGEQSARLNHLLARCISEILAERLAESSAILANSFEPGTVHPLYPCCVLTLLGRLVKNKAEACLPQLLFLVTLLLKCLDPSCPGLRKWCRLPALRVMEALARFESVSFSESSLKLAVYAEGEVALYDLRSAVRWKTLEALDTRVIAFSPLGKYLAGYQPKSSQVVVWKVGAAGFWGGLRWLEGEERKAYRVERTLGQQACELRWKNDEKEVTLVSATDVINFKL